MPFYPQRVFSRILKPQKASKTWTTPVYLNSTTADTDFSLDESLLSSSSDSEAENDEVIDATERGRAEKLNIPTRSEFSMLVVFSS